MTARDSFRALFGALDEASTAELDRRLGAHRTEVLTEAAAFVGNDDTCDCGGCNTCYGRHLAAGLLAMAGEEATAPATATPDFFQAGHRYALDVWRFHCGTVTAHPETGEQSALGWLQISDGSWTTYAYSVDAWGEGWTDVTEAGDRRG